MEVADGAGPPVLGAAVQNEGRNSHDRPARRAGSRGRRTDEPRRTQLRHLLPPAARTDRLRDRRGGGPDGLADRRPAPVPRIGKSEEGHLYVHQLAGRSEEHTSELQSLMRISYAVFCLKKKK